MPTFSVFEEKAKVKPTLRLIDHGDGEPVLCVVDPETGDKLTNILEIESSGTIRLIGGVDKRFGFDLDENGYVKTRKG